jgi:hypothetical protein
MSSFDPDVHQLGNVWVAALFEDVNPASVSLHLEGDGQLDEQPQAAARAAITRNQGLFYAPIVKAKRSYQRRPERC